MGEIITLFEVYPCFPGPATFNKQNQETETADR